MKFSSKLPKITSILMLVFFVSISISCNNKKSNEKGFYNGSSDCDLITTDDIRSIFNLNASVEIEQEKKLGEICYYRWESPQDEKMKHAIRFAFSRWEQKSTADMDKTWKKQNESVYKKHNMQNVPGVGDKASWSDYEQGQLRVTENGFIFYISLYVKSRKDNALNRQELIDKTSALAKKVIKRM